MSSSGDVTQWFRQLEVGDREAVQRLWERYYRGLVGLARKKLGALPRRAADEEDVALSAFDSFVRGAQEGRFPRLEDRDDLWQILVLITTRKAIDLAAHEGRDKRDWRRVQAQSDGDAEDGGALLRGLIGREPDPAFAAQVAEQCRHLLALLPDDELRQIALLKLEGWTNEEIAAALDVALKTVERRLRLIRKHWASAAISSEAEK
jgi:DNA-directed RNA polymerase specialized sigma24 family protein